MTHQNRVIDLARRVRPAPADFAAAAALQDPSLLTRLQATKGHVAVPGYVVGKPLGAPPRVRHIARGPRLLAASPRPAR